MKFWSPEKPKEEEKKSTLRSSSRAKSVLMGATMLASGMASAQEAPEKAPDHEDPKMVKETVWTDGRNTIKTKTFHPEEDVWGDKLEKSVEEEPEITTPEVVKSVETERDSSFKLIEGDRYIAVEMHTDNFDGMVMITGEGYVKIPDDHMEINKDFEIDDYLIEKWDKGLSRTQKDRIENQATELIILKEIEESEVITVNDHNHYLTWLQKRIYVLNRSVEKYLTTENEAEDEIKEHQNKETYPGQRRIENKGLAVANMEKKYGRAKFIKPGVLKFKKGYIGFMAMAHDQMTTSKQIHTLTMENRDLIEGEVLRTIDEQQTKRQDGVITYVRVYKMVDLEEE